MTAGLPRELPPLVALALGAALVLWPRARVLFVRGSDRMFVLIAAATAAFLSGAYIAFYLRGGPRIIDATTYWLEAKALSHGYLAWPAGEPSQSVVGRFLVRDVHGSGDNVAAIFPPGYPLLLALGFLFRAPMAIGPLLAFALTFATAFLAEAALPSALAAADRRVAVRLAVVLSVACGALRYHTADTMSHGLAAVLVTVSLAAALRLRRQPAWRDVVLLGAALGWLACTRPVTAMAIAPVAMVAASAGFSFRRIGVAVASSAPFFVLLFAHQRAATGSLGGSSQALYYATSDTPVGCFKYGFGDAVGCRFEHGDFVERYMPSGFGLFEAAGTTARRLSLHAMDALNAAPLAIAVLGAIVLVFVGRARPAVSNERLGLRILVGAIGAVVVAYVPFYFDGNVPGAGARFFADVLPLEHILVAWAAIAFGPDATTAQRLAPARVATIATGLSLVGFAFFAHVDHASLRDREGGRPMFERAVLEANGVDSGLVFVDTDHGFGIGYDPDARATSGIEVARSKGDAIDGLLWEARGRPPAFTYRYILEDGRSIVAPWAPTNERSIEGESLWPAVEQTRATAVPSHTAEPCASAGKWLLVSTDGSARAGRVRLRLPPLPAGTRLVPTFVVQPGARVSVAIESGQVASASTSLDGSNRPSKGPGCIEGAPLTVPSLDIVGGRIDLSIEVSRVEPSPGASSEQPLDADRVSVALDSLRLENPRESR